MSGSLNPWTLPLTGNRLIEASAGTGKTWTIASLYVRLVLGLGTPQARPLEPREILVLTFTRAATRELVDRIRRRLVQAQRALEGFRQPGAAEPGEDPFLDALCARFASASERAEAVWRLERAAAGMDEAAVSTIDAWVQRVLQEHSTDAHAAARLQLLENDQAWIDQAVQDYWRQQVYPLEPPAMSALAEVAGDAQRLSAWLTPALRADAPAPRAPEQPLGEVLNPWAQTRAAALQQLKADWPSRALAMRQWLQACLSHPKRPLDGRRLRPETFETWCTQLERWAASDSASLPGVNVGAETARTMRRRLTPAGLVEAHRDSFGAVTEQEMPDWSHAFEALVHALDQWPTAHQVLGLHALSWVHERLDKAKRDGGAWSFDDLIKRLDLELHQQEELAARLRARYPAALVDEFQDTSPLQLRVLDRLYRIAQPADDATLLLIGDPKQSIYRFRGADIHSYLLARQATEGRHHALDTNHRSVPELVEAVNRLFLGVESQADAQGAFLHGPEVPFAGVKPRSHHPVRLCKAGKPMPVLQVWTEARTRSAREGRALDAERAAERLVGLLNDESVGFQHEESGWRRLQPRDLCVLVRTREEAAVMRRALARRGVASAYLSERDSVLQSEEALEVLGWLRALSAPQDLRLARRVWGGSLMGLPLKRQHQERDDEAVWESRLAQLQLWSERWRREGVMSAIRAIIQDCGIAARLLDDLQGGERRLTNALHLAEWLQELSRQHPAHTALVRAFERAVAQAALDSGSTQPGEASQPREATLLRLESDADLIQIVTIHKSKGLQYPIVMLPFAGSVRVERQKGPSHRLEFRHGAWSALPRPDAEDLQVRLLEQRREDVRLFYVAVTRAVHQVWIGACPRAEKSQDKPNWHLSGLGRLVSGQERADAQSVVDDLRRVFEAAGPEGPMLECLDPDAVEPVTRLQARAPTEAKAPLQARVMGQAVPRGWGISSYSALVRWLSPEATEWDEGRWDERPANASVAEDATHAPPPPGSASGPWHSLESSAALGQFLHELLERCARAAYDWHPGSPLESEVREAIACSAWACEAQSLESWLMRILELRLPFWGAGLSSLRGVCAELEFWLPLAPLDTSGLDRLCRRHLWPGRDRPALEPRRIEGLLMGFADLVIEHDGRLGVLDYKSNRLGASVDGYGTGALEEAVLAHRYDVQAALYVLALHRLLQHRLGSAYDPQRHLGPAQFFFLRGVDHPSGGVLSLEEPWRWVGEFDQLVNGT